MTKTAKEKALWHATKAHKLYMGFETETHQAMYDDHHHVVVTIKKHLGSIVKFYPEDALILHICADLIEHLLHSASDHKTGEALLATIEARINAAA